jgi:acylphosphatase
MKKKLLILGEVHGVGYRPFLLGIAESLEIERFFADNLKLNGKKAVLVLLDSSPDKVESFIEIAKTRHPEHAVVESMTVEDYKGNVMKIENYYRYLSAMQLSKIATYGKHMLIKQDEHIEISKQTLKELREMSKKQDEHIEISKETLKITKEILHKQEEHIDLTKEILHKQEEHIDLTKEILHKQEEHIDLTKELIHETRHISAKQDEHIDLTKEILHKQDEHIDLTKELIHETRHISAKQDEHISIARSTEKKLDSFSRTEEEIKKLRQEFQQLKEAIRRAGIEV